MSDFVHLHTHSEFSLLDGASRIQEMVAAAKAAGQTALALTDHGSLYGVVPFYKACVAAGIKPLIGCETYVAQRTLHDKESKVDRDPHHLVLIAANQTGYRNLMKMISTAHLQGYYVRPRVDKELMAAHSEGVIALSACLAGEVSERVQTGDVDGGVEVAEQYREIFGDRYFLEIQNHGIPEEDTTRQGVIEVARRTGIPLVATNDSHYTAQADAQMHDVLLCIQTGKRVADVNRMKFSGDGFYLKPEEEMLQLFPECAEAVRNTAGVAAMCDLAIELGGMLLPRYDVPGGMDADAYLRTLCEDGFRRRYPEATKEQQTRLDYELQVITEMGYAAYFLIVWDFVHHAKTHDVLVGPGRGSAAGSMVSYCLDITTLDPLKYGLIFERFLNRDRVSMPDIDIDFSVAGRESVIRYVTQKYGQERVAQIGTFGTMAGKAAIRDVGRVLDISIPEVDPIAKMIPVHQGKTVSLEKSLEQVAELRGIYASDPRYKELIDTAQRLEGITRSVGTHAAGVVISQEPIVNHAPLQRGTTDKSTIVTQYEMNAIQELGLLKMDFLGLRNLDIIDACLRIVRQTRGDVVLIEDILLDDAATYEMLCRGDTLGIFQLESPGMRRILAGLRPSQFEDISVVNALYRPGPIEAGLIDQYVACKHGLKEVEYLHPLLEEVLRETYGVPVYQEQVMQIAITMAGFTRGESDILRAAMGKKDKAKMAKQREKFIAGCVARAIPEHEAQSVFEKVEYFAGYGFNKAHAAAYGMISYQTAYLKANYTIEYLCALLQNEADQGKVAAVIVDCQDHHIDVLPPDVNTSEADFAVVQMPAGDVNGRISFGLRGIKNVGVKAIELLVEERRQNGAYASLLDLCLRLDLHEVNKRVLEALVKCGAMDSLGERAQLLTSLDLIVDRAQQVQRERASGQVSLFGEESGMGGEDVEVRLVVGVPAADDRTRLAWEREFLGIYLSDHPLRHVEADLHARTDTRCIEITTELEGFQVRIGGVVREIRRRPDRTGKNMAFVELEDLTGSVSVTIFSRVLEQAGELLQPDRIVLLSGKVDTRRRSRDGGDSEEASIVADAVWAFDGPDPAGWQRAQVVHLAVPLSLRESDLPAVADLLGGYPGPDPVVLHFEDAEQAWELELPGVQVSHSPELAAAVEAMLGPASYRCEVVRQRAPERRPFRERERGGEAA
ncbi:MAG TPA: DNA polymerase III subunit alpha [Candidatus Dormibacteraeota bacterium]|jgi:DNA polymerase-3 subunit alpha|nr:DNA polymerase III subunit alpha [Candidatus Dormibacteraeota bacterium]